ncbi:MAG: hypothetical protein AAF591_20955 [Verrucomicrobiota bacterium]
MNQKNTPQSHGQTLFALAIALMVVPEWATIWQFIDHGPIWIASMLLSAFLITLAALAWRGLYWAKVTLIVLISLGVLIKAISLVSGQFSKPALVGLTCYSAGLLLLTVPKSVDTFLTTQREKYEKNKNQPPPTT